MAVIAGSATAVALLLLAAALHASRKRRNARLQPHPRSASTPPLPTATVATATFQNDNYVADDDAASVAVRKFQASVATTAAADGSSLPQKVLVSARRSQASAAVMTLQGWRSGERDSGDDSDDAYHHDYDHERGELTM